jgi:hypothetical protein
VKVSTPFGEYPFVYRRMERRDDGLAIVGTVAGVDSSVVLDRDDALAAAKVLGAVAGLGIAVSVLRRLARA